MKKIIFINRFFYPDQSATSQILSDLIFNIQEQIQAEIHVVTSRNVYQGDKCLPASEVVNGIIVHRVWTSNFGRSILTGRAVDYLTFYLSAFFVLFFLARKDDVLIAKTDPPVISIVAWLVTKLKTAKLINWIQDLFPEVAGALGVMRPDSVLYRLLKRIKNITMRAAVCNVVIGERMKDRLVEDGVDVSKIHVIHNWNINQDEKYIPKKDNHLVTEWGLQDKFVIGYSGNFGRAHEYDPVVKLIDHFANNEKIVFLFIGGGKYYDDLKNHVQENSLKNVMFKPYQDKAVLSYSLSVPDLHLISLVPELEGLIVPSKFYGLAAIGLPVLFIGSENGELASILKDNDCGFVVSGFDSEITDLISNLLSGERDSGEMKLRLRNVNNKYFMAALAYEKWTIIINSYNKIRKVGA